MKLISILVVALGLAGCSTNSVVLKNAATGKTASCGDTPLSLGHFSAPQDQACIQSYQRRGYAEVQMPYCIGRGFCRGEGF